MVTKSSGVAKIKSSETTSAGHKTVGEQFRIDGSG